VTATADLIVTGTIITMDPTQPEVDAIALSGGRIIGAGSLADVEGRRTPNTDLLELGDHVVLPGLIEPHMHLWSTVLYEAWIDCSAITHQTFDGVVAALTDAATKVAPGEWVTGKLFDPSLYPGEPELHRDRLDQIAPDNPLLVINASMHYAYANSKALEAGGLTDSTPDPVGGRFIREDGRLNGVLSEFPAMHPVWKAAPRLSHDDLLAGLVRIMTRAARSGVTKIHDAATGALFGAAELDILHGLADAGQLPVRITTAQLDITRAVWEDVGLRPLAGHDLVRATSWKVVSDGSNQGRSGYMTQSYLGSDARGAPNMSLDELVESVTYGHGHGWQVMVHANGDAAIELTVSAYEQALARAGVHDLRHRIEHCSLASQDHLRRMADLGVSPSFLMNHVYFWGETFRDTLLGPERADGLDPVASARRAGLRPTFHSDHSVTPIEPLLAVKTAVTRRMRVGGEVLGSGERDTVEAALRAVTIDAAWQTHSDDIGSIEVGKEADLAILAEDPRSVDPEHIGEIEVLGTLLGGERVWSA
jgi:hypothetical protein